MSQVFDGGNAFSQFTQEDPTFVGSFAGASRTVQQVQQAVYRQFGDEANVQISDPDIIRWVNDAALSIANRIHYLKARSSVTATPGQASYRWPAERILQVESIHYAGVPIKNLAFKQAEESIAARDPQMEQSGFPEFWYEWAGKFMFWPVPDEAQTIDLYLTLYPQPVTQISDVLPVPDKMFSDVVKYCLSQAFELDENWEAANVKNTQFASSVSGMADEAREAQHLTYDVINVVD